MATKNIKATATTDLESKLNTLEERISVFEKLVPKKLFRKQREYTPEQRAAIRARFLAGKEAARRRKENELIAEVIVKPKAEMNDDIEVIKTEKPKKAIKTEKTKKKA